MADTHNQGEKTYAKARQHPWDILDGKRMCEWYHKLTFTGGSGPYVEPARSTKLSVQDARPQIQPDHNTWISEQGQRPVCIWNYEVFDEVVTS